MSFIEQQEIDCDLSPASTLMLVNSTSAAASAKVNLAAGETWNDGNVHISVAYNGLGIMPGQHRADQLGCCYRQ